MEDVKDGHEMTGNAVTTGRDTREHRNAIAARVSYERTGVASRGERFAGDG